SVTPSRLELVRADRFVVDPAALVELAHLDREVELVRLLPGHRGPPQAVPLVGVAVRAALVLQFGGGPAVQRDVAQRDAVVRRRALRLVLLELRLRREQEVLRAAARLL